MFAYHDSREQEPESVWEREEVINEDGHRMHDNVSALEMAWCGGRGENGTAGMLRTP